MKGVPIPGTNHWPPETSNRYLTILKVVQHPVFMKHRKKSDLPTKVCPVCQRPFPWRKKWTDVWDEVVYCSEQCRRNRNTKKSVL